MFPKLFASLAIIFILAAPLALFAHGFPPTPLVPTCADLDEADDASTAICDFDDLTHLIRHLVDFALFLVMPIAVCLFAWAGWLYLSSGGDSGKVGTAKKIFWAIAIGLFWILGAWLVIKLISDALLQESFRATGV